MKHSIRIVLVVIIFVSFAAGLVVAAEPIPFSLKRGIPEIEVIINDSVKASFVIDTGADHIYIDKTFAEKHGLLSGRTQAMRPTRGSKGSTEAKLFSVESLKFGDEAFLDLSMVAIDLVSQIKDTSMGYPDGVLGYSFLKNHNILLYYLNSTLVFLDSIAVSQSFTVDKIPFVLERHLIVVKATFNDSVEVNLILDTGSSYTLLSPMLAQKLGINETAFVNKINLSQKLFSEKVEIRVREIGAIASVIKDSEIAGVLGTSFLKGQNCLIDYKSNRLLFYARSVDELIELAEEARRLKSGH